MAEDRSSKLLRRAKLLKAKLVNIRREIHSFPEPGFMEEKTSALIQEELKKIGINFKAGIAKTGITGLIEGSKDGPVVALRADMDCLTIQEETGAPYASKRSGLMHACGHDGHVACLLGAAMLLKEEDFAGKVKLIFQPAEEGPGGAEVMIEEGVLKDPPVKAIIAAHLTPTIDVGKIGITAGQTHAATIEIKIIMEGKGGHAAYPHKGVDAIAMAAEAIVSMQKIISRQIDPFEPAVLTIGTIKGGSRHNILAHKVEMEGTIRCFSNKTVELIPELLKQTLDGVVKTWGGAYEVDFIKSYPPVICDPDVVDTIKAAGEKLLGKDNIVMNYSPTMGGEDFSFFTQNIPGAMFRLGCGGPAYKHNLHHPEFDFDEDALVTGSAVLAEGALEMLNWLK